jgi:hypothetical protein
MGRSRWFLGAVAGMTLGLLSACGSGDVAGGDLGLQPEPPPGDTAGGSVGVRFKGIVASACEAASSCLGVEFWQEFDSVDACVEASLADAELDPDALAAVDPSCADAMLSYVECYFDSLGCAYDEEGPTLVEPADGTCSGLEADASAVCGAYQ